MMMAMASLAELQRAIEHVEAEIASERARRSPTDLRAALAAEQARLLELRAEIQRRRVDVDREMPTWARRTLMALVLVVPIYALLISAMLDWTQR
jgi:hypothetical protein